MCEHICGHQCHVTAGDVEGLRCHPSPCPICSIMPEFAPAVLDSLRGPLETGEVMVARANAHVRYPARVQLVAAMNPCRCGHGGAGRGACGRAPKCQLQYQGRISGPLMDRIDLHVEVPPVTAADLALPPPAEGTAEAAARVAAARATQAERSGGLLNAHLEGQALERACALEAAAHALLTRAAEAQGLSARGWTRTLRLARTVADLDRAERVRRTHIAEALIYRRPLHAPRRDGANDGHDRGVKARSGGRDGNTLKRAKSDGRELAQSPSFEQSILQRRGQRPRLQAAPERLRRIARAGSADRTAGAKGDGHGCQGRRQYRRPVPGWAWARRRQPSVVARQPAPRRPEPARAAVQPDGRGVRLRRSVQDPGSARRDRRPPRPDDGLAAVVAGRLRSLRRPVHPPCVAQRRHLPHHRRPRRGRRGSATVRAP